MTHATQGRSPIASRVVPVRLDDTLLNNTDARARAEGSNRSSIIRAALRAYLAERATPSTSPPRLTPSQHSRLREICTRYGVATLEIFGSAARGDATKSSDVDLLYTLQPGARLGWEIDDLADELTSVLGRPVDLIARRALHPEIRTRALAEALVLYAA